jgi:hypothetical protein
VSPVKYELGFISQKTTFFIVTTVKTSNFTCILNFTVVLVRGVVVTLGYADS